MINAALISIALTLVSASNGPLTLPADFHPESLIRLEDGSLIAGSAVGGGIYKFDPVGRGRQLVEAGRAGLMSVQGLFADEGRGRLYACSADLGVAPISGAPSALFIFDLFTGERRSSHPLPPGGFCNDVERLDDRALLVTDSLNARILRFDATTLEWSAWVEDPILGGAQFNGNGIVRLPHRVLVSTFSDGRIVSIDVSPAGEAGRVSELILDSDLNGADALRLSDDGRIFAFWNGLPTAFGGVSELRLRDGGHAKLHPVAEGFDNPTSGLIYSGVVHLALSQFAKLFGDEKGTLADAFEIERVTLPGRIETLDLPNGLDWPNGIAVAQDGALIVGSITAPTVARYAAGSWGLKDVGTDATFSVTSLTVDAPRGLLWGTSPAFLERARDQSHGLFALDGESLEPVFERSLPDDGFANDTELGFERGLLVTDSTNGRLLTYDPEADAFTTLVQDDRLRPVVSVGAAGVTVGPDGSAYVTNYDAGTLFRFADGQMAPVDLPRQLFNPDGLAMHGADLILVEGAAASGDGKVLRIRDPHRPGVRPVITLADGLESPVNLTVDDNGDIWVTESQIRRVLRGEPVDTTIPFRVVKITSAAGGP